jgi:hypothetical protein
MSYDPYNEEIENLISDILNAFDSLPKRTRKLLFASLFDRISSLKMMLEEKGKPVSDEDLHLELTANFDKIQCFSVSEARRFLGELMKRELP